MTDLEKHVSRPGRDKIVKRVRETPQENNIFFYICTMDSAHIIEIDVLDV